ASAPRPSISGPTALPYVGSDGGAGAGGGAQDPNPMVQSGAFGHRQQPFVGVLDVGQGNCNALYNNAGEAFVYYDFGFPTNSKKGSAPNPITVPCLCNNPLIVISHWDADHYALSRRYPECYKL